MENQDEPRMPAILENEDWATWLGENEATPDQASFAAPAGTPLRAHSRQH
jgi:putative SOS response-associated peptidase YedK